MTEIEFSERARGELDEIYLSGYQRFGKWQAERYIDEFEHIFELLAENPRMGRRAEAIASNVRRHEHGRHIILYEEIANGIAVLAVVHASAMRLIRL